VLALGWAGDSHGKLFRARGSRVAQLISHDNVEAPALPCGSEPQVGAFGYAVFGAGSGLADLDLSGGGTGISHPSEDNAYTTAP
jgi:hypothetical protein